MKIYAWNMLYENERLDETFSFLASLDFDIFCLQEVPGEFMPQLRTLPCHLAHVVEYNYVRKDQVPRQTLSVILSRYPIASSEAIRVPNWFLHPLLRERITVSLLRFFRVWRWTKSHGDRNHLRAWIDIPGVGRTQVYSLHLTIHSPAARKEELAAVLKQYAHGEPALICGDLNIFDRYRVAVPSWFFGATLADVLMPWRERAHAESFFTSLGLRNPLRGMLTHQITRCQLDHILVSEQFTITSAAVVQERYGSDHNPVFVALEA